MTLLTTWPTVTDDSGTKQDGTIFNQTLTNAMKSAIEAVVHSTTNTTTTPEDIIDEVVTARGSMPSLDARLDVALNEDGTPKASATDFPTASAQLMVGGRNVAINGDFNIWTAGTTSAPDGWTLAGAAGTIAQCGPGMGDTTSLGAGTYCAAVTRAGTNVTLSQDVVAAADVADFAEMKSRDVAICAKVKASAASVARLQVDDGVATTSSSYHTGGGTVEHLTAVHPINSGATKLTIMGQVNNTNASPYFGGFMCVFSSVAPSDWQPLSREGLATRTRYGLLSVGTQTIGGQKNMDLAPAYKPGTAANVDTTVSGSRYRGTTAGANGTTVETTLDTVTLQASHLAVNGQMIRITFAGQLANTANQKTIKIYFGATSVTVLSASTDANLSYWGECIVTRLGAASQRMHTRYSHGTTGGTPNQSHATATPTETLSGTVVVKITGQSNAASNDITNSLFLVETIG